MGWARLTFGSHLLGRLPAYLYVFYIWSFGYSSVGAKISIFWGILYWIKDLTLDRSILTWTSRSNLYMLLQLNNWDIIFWLFHLTKNNIWCKACLVIIILLILNTFLMYFKFIFPIKCILLIGIFHLQYYVKIFFVDCFEKKINNISVDWEYV